MDLPKKKKIDADLEKKYKLEMRCKYDRKMENSDL
jgi:hypothetical protein